MMSKLYVAPTTFTGLRTTRAGTSGCLSGDEGNTHGSCHEGVGPRSIFEVRTRGSEGNSPTGRPRSTEVRIRAVSPGYEDELREMLSRLSRETIHKRFHLPMPHVPEWMLAYLVDVDHYDKEALVALVGDEIVGHTMYVRQEAREAEMAIVVEDRWQSRGTGRLLLSRLAEEAGRRGIESFTGTVLGENRDALRFFSSVLLKTKFEIKNSVYHLYLPLSSLGPTRSLGPPEGARTS